MSSISLTRKPFSICCIVLIFPTFHTSQSSRDITNLSKKVIFLLHRAVTEDTTETDDRALGSRAAARAKPKLKEIQSLFAGIRPELTGDTFARYQRNVSPGLQEYIEALSFAHYLEHQSLISYEEVQTSLSDENGIPASYLRHSRISFGADRIHGLVLPSAARGLSTRPFRPDRRTHAIRHCCNIAAWWPTEG